MKKLLTALLVLSTYLTACNSAHNKTGGATRDSSASHGDSGPDTAFGAAVPEAQSTSGTDTSSDGHGVDDPVADTVKAKKHK
jgi:predicted small secreted protein